MLQLLESRSWFYLLFFLSYITLSHSSYFGVAYLWFVHKLYCMYDLLVYWLELSSIFNSSILYRVATDLENLEYSGISLNVENSGNSVQPQGKIVTSKVFLVSHSNISAKQLLAG